jgi:peroxiredoxin
MKSILFCIALMSIVSVSVAQPSGFVLKGDISKVTSDPIEWVYIMYAVNGQYLTDSVRAKEGAYRFSGNITEATQARLRVKYKTLVQVFNRKRDAAIVFLQPGNITVTSVDSFANITVTGSNADIEYRKLELQAKSFNDKLDDLYRQVSEAKKNNNTTALKELEEEIDQTDEEANEKVYGLYVKQHPTSPLALYALRNWAGYDIDAAKTEPVFMALPAATRNSPGGKEMFDKIEIAKKSGIGRQALNFTQPDTSGTPVSLASFRGKYLLVDFWASWCGPCRAENPNVVKAFAKYKEKGFYILGVSLDRPGAKEKWLKAIHDDGLNWAHVSDLQYWDNAVAKQYGIQAIPQNLLLDPSGKIIGKNLRGDKLDKKLASIFPE